MYIEARTGGDLSWNSRLFPDTSGVNIRTLQQYEVAAKDINKAAAYIVICYSEGV